jgi:hypothetical protein
MPGRNARDDPSGTGKAIENTGIDGPKSARGEGIIARE